MVLHFIGLGLNDEKDITVKGLEAVKKCDVLYLEYYTSILQVPKEQLEKFYGKKINLAPRSLVEQDAETTILKDAKEKETGFLVIGDPFCATTHMDLYMRAKGLGIVCHVIPNASVMSAIGMTGLQVYKFGKTTSIPFHHDQVDSPYEVMKANQKMGLHTLFLLDLDPIEGKFMSVGDGVRYLLKTALRKGDKGFTDSTLCIGCARLGSENQVIYAGSASAVLRKDFGKAVHCLIVPGTMHFMEEEVVGIWK